MSEYLDQVVDDAVVFHEALAAPVAGVDAVLLSVEADLQGLGDSEARARVQAVAERLAMAANHYRRPSG